MFKNVRKEIITVPAQMSYLSQVRDFIEQVGRKYKYSDKISNSFKLVIDEACTNIIRHGYRDIKGGEITLKAIIRSQSLTVVVIDQGKSYDPRQANTPDLEKYVDIGKKGGLGILMMRKLMDEVQYNITSRGNELRLTKQRDQLDYSGPQALWENLSMRAKYTIIASTIMTFMLGFIFFSLYLQVDNNTLDEVINIAGTHTLSLADNSINDLQIGNDIPLFELTNNIKTNNPNLIYESFIIDTAFNIWALTLRDYQIDKYQIPDLHEDISDTAKLFKLYKYQTIDNESIYDFSAKIHAVMVENSPILGYAHIWVKTDYILEKAAGTKREIILWIIFLSIIINIGIYFLVTKIVKPFHSLAEWVRQVGQGSVDEDEIDIDSSDELGEVAQAFNQMTGKFREAQVNLMEQQRLQKELQVAQEIQHMLLPSDFPKVEGYDIASFYEAAKEVGGDLFDFVEVDEDTIGVCVADVSGKGVPGSLIMTMIRTALRLEARGNKNPADVLSRVNNFVTDDMRRGMFVTMFYLVLDSRNRIIHYASAGHNPMMLYRRSSKNTYYLNPSGFPVGIQLPEISLFDKKIEVDSIRLREDDMLVLYTDGITEAMNPERELYREERFLEAVRNNSHYDVGEFVKQLRDDINNHTKGYPQNDDITYVAIKEKMMAGEIIYNIHKELFKLIDEEGVTVKDACDKMRVSQYMYRKYKKIKEQNGYEGLRDLLNESDYIEKKHLSLEVKTKLYEVIRKNPQFGAKKISATLDTEEYGNTKLEEHRIYQELKKAKLNTRQRREIFVERGGKKRIKLPGTPLLTMDGEVILNFESAEKVIAEKRGVISESLPDRSKFIEQQKTTDRKFKAIVSNVEPQKKVEPEIKREEKSDQIAEEEQVKKNLKPETIEDSQLEPESVPDVDQTEAEPEEEKTAKQAEEILSERSEKTVEIEEQAQVEEILIENREPEVESDEVEDITELEPVIIPETIQKTDDRIIKKAVKPVELGEQIQFEEKFAENFKEEQKLYEDNKPTKKEKIDTFSAPETYIDKNIIEKFYLTVTDDFEIINKIINSADNDSISQMQLAKILTTLKIISTNPLLNKIIHIKKLFGQVTKGIEFLMTNNEQFKNKMLENIQEMLNYVKKENILPDSNFIIERMNELGIHLFKLEKEVDKEEPKLNSDIALIRKKIADKRILKTKSY